MEKEKWPKKPTVNICHVVYVWIRVIFFFVFSTQNPFQILHDIFEMIFRTSKHGWVGGVNKIVQNKNE